MNWTVFAISMMVFTGICLLFRALILAADIRGLDNNYRIAVAMCLAGSGLLISAAIALL